MFFLDEKEKVGPFVDALKAEGVSAGGIFNAGIPDWHIYAHWKHVIEEKAPTPVKCPWDCPYHDKAPAVKYAADMSNLKRVSKRGVIDLDREIKETGENAKQFGVKCSSIFQSAGNLSGGNQQKTVLAKWMFNWPDVLILDEPTRGIDVGAKYDIYCIINQLAADGKCVLVISSELDELLGICDRIYIMSKGVWNAIEAAGLQKSCVIASQGFYDWSIDYLKSDKFLFTITYPAGFFSRDAMKVLKKAVTDYRIPLLAVVLFLIMALLKSNFASAYNVYSIADSAAGYGIAAIGFTFILLVGQLDISFGSVIALTACVLMMMLKAGMSFALALAAALVLGCVCGAITGFFVAKFRLSPFIVTMNSDCILDEKTNLEIYGTEGILTMGDPNQFGAPVYLQKTLGQPVQVPFTHGYAENSRGLGAAEMAWSIAAGRNHRASKEMAFHVFEMMHGVMSRGKAAQAVESGKLELNYLVCQKPDKQVAEGDVISIRGLGKIRLESVGGTTKKGRIGIVISRFV